MKKVERPDNNGEDLKSEAEKHRFEVLKIKANLLSMKNQTIADYDKKMSTILEMLAICDSEIGKEE